MKNSNSHVISTEQSVNKIIDNSPIGYFRIGSNLKWQYVNPAWEKMHGYKLNEVIGKSYNFTQTEENSNEAENIVNRVLNGEVLDGEFDRRDRDGNIGYHSYYVQPIFLNSEIVAIEGYIIDVTKLKKVELQLIESHEQLLSIFDSIDEPIYICDPKTYDILYANKLITFSGATALSPYFFDSFV